MSEGGVPHLYKMQTPLTDQEMSIFSLLITVKKYFNIETGIRVVGGWVRDKVMRLESHDIDITTDGVSGVEFSNYVIEYLHANNIPTSSTKYATQSEHLATATVSFYGLSIDFNSPRAEEYHDTRIPIIRKGTLLEDCLRRDFTINGLFYRIEDGVIEDYSSGYADINNKVLKTPIDPFVSFVDDPLRVYRGIRFASKFTFTIEKNTWEAMHSEAFKRVTNKVTKERRLPEINNILKTCNAGFGLHCLADCGLIEEVVTCNAIQTVLPNFMYSDYAAATIKLAYICEGILKRCFETPEVFNSLTCGYSSNANNKDYSTVSYFNDIANYGEIMRILGLCSICFAFKDITYVFKNKTYHVYQNVIIDGLKMTAKDRELVDCIFDSVNLFQEKSDVCERLILGRMMLKAKTMWTVVCVFYIAIHCVIDIPQIPFLQFGFDGKEAHAKLLALYSKIYNYGLVHIWELEPAFNGNQIAELFNKKKGKWIQKAMSDLIEYQIAHPEYTTESCKLFLCSQNYN
ncbi:polyA polymerase, putative [Entamoeba invadens IP1]|uniref:polyA polymerase, putative n=1 Tax=Entamoeba invadens IP1 TaxID=370355 RepID=UPI0002C3EF65|nr:polyA polymerase, putative [Entamoeba invadens IP1]ELP90476.1 polyA polymerase, putative [Entamoeba invadens IP1]|eukprot:XP_004257247.1 polyA polymerase, putative [Entamoeba invadens IP1]